MTTNSLVGFASENRLKYGDAYTIYLTFYSAYSRIACSSLTSYPMKIKNSEISISSVSWMGVSYGSYIQTITGNLPDKSSIDSTLIQNNVLSM